LINSSARLRNKEKAVIAHYFREPDVFSGLRGVIPRGGEDKLGAGIIQAPTIEGRLEGKFFWFERIGWRSGAGADHNHRGWRAYRNYR
jgi:hypothetical protein